MGRTSPRRDRRVATCALATALFLAGVAAAWSPLGCGSEIVADCVTGQQSACVCADGAPGSQLCNAASTYEPCVCGQGGQGGDAVGPGGGGGVGATGGGGSGASGGGGSGGSGPCAPAAVEPCYEGTPGTENNAPCMAGTRICAVDGTWGACMGQVLPVTEQCQTATDEDCDGATPACAGPWALGLGNNSVGQHVATDALGNVYVMGYFGDTVDFGGVGQLVNVGTNDLFVVKLSPEGVHQWSFQLGDPIDTVEPGGLAVDSGGNVFVAFNFAGTPSLLGEALTSEGERDIAIVKVLPTGAKDWLAAYGSTGFDHPYAIAVDDDDNLVIAARHNNPIFFGGTEVLSGPAMAVVKLAPNGDHLLSRDVYPGSTPATIATVPGTNDILVGGSWNGSVDLGMGQVSSNTDGRLFVARLDETGTVLDYFATGGTSSNVTYPIALLPAGTDVIVGGRFSGTLDLGQTTPIPTQGTSNNIFIARLDATNNPVWLDTYFATGSSSTLQLAAPVLTSTGDILVAAYTNTSVDLTGATVTDTAFLFNLDSAGAYVSSTSYAPFALQTQDAAISPDGVPVVVGAYYGAGVTVAGTTLPTQPGGGGFVARLAP